MAFWDDVWRSPMSTEFHSSDQHQLLLLMNLYHDYAQAESATLRANLAGEIRLQRKDFGLTPYDRRRLEWSIESAEAAKDAGNRRRARNAAQPVEAPPVADPRANLRAV